MERGRLVWGERREMILSRVSSSLMPGIPAFTSSIAAPVLFCSRAMVCTVVKTPSLSSAWSFFFPVGLMRSPMMRTGLPDRVITASRALERAA